MDSSGTAHLSQVPKGICSRHNVALAYSNKKKENLKMRLKMFYNREKDFCKGEIYSCMFEQN